MQSERNRGSEGEGARFELTLEEIRLAGLIRAQMALLRRWSDGLPIRLAIGCLFCTLSGFRPSPPARQRPVPSAKCHSGAPCCSSSRPVPAPLRAGATMYDVRCAMCDGRSLGGGCHHMGQKR